MGSKKNRNRKSRKNRNRKYKNRIPPSSNRTYAIQEDFVNKATDKSNKIKVTDLPKDHKDKTSSIEATGAKKIENSLSETDFIKIFLQNNSKILKHEISNIIQFLLKLFLSMVFWISTICIITILVFIIRIGNAAPISRIILMAPEIPFLFIAYIVIILILLYLKGVYGFFEQTLKSQLKQFYFILPILASLLFVAIDRVNS